MRVDENTIHMINPTNMKFLKFVKKTQSELVAQHIVRLRSLISDIILDSLQLMNVNIDDTLQEFLMNDFEYSVKAAKVLLDVKRDLNQIINIKKTIHSKAIFDHMFKFVIDDRYPGRLAAVRKSLETLWESLDEDEKEESQEMVNKMISEYVQELGHPTDNNETIIENLQFFRQFLF